MKKILLLIVSGLLIACMAGSAMANPCDIRILKDPFSIVSGEDSGTVVVDKYLLSGTRTISVETSSDAIEAQIEGMGTQWASGATRESMTYTITGSYNNTLGYVVDSNNDMVEAQFTLKVRQKAGSQLTGGFVTVFDNDGSVFSQEYYNDKASVSAGASIPEYPIAVGGAVAIGLLFMFGRKKEGL